MTINNALCEQAVTHLLTTICMAHFVLDYLHEIPDVVAACHIYSVFFCYGVQVHVNNAVVNVLK